MSDFENLVPVVWRQSEQIQLSSFDAYRAFADTDRFSRLRGDGLLTVEEQKLDHGEVVRLVKDGGGAEYVEEPWEWEKGRRFSVLRRHKKGLLKGYTWAIEFHDLDQGCELRFAADFYPRWRWARPLLWLVARFAVSREVSRILDQVRAAAARGSDDRFVLPAPPVDNFAINEERVGRARDQLIAAGSSPAIVDSMLRLIREETDLELVNIKPLQLAQRHGFDEEQTVLTFLQATREGYLELRWSVICPSCRGNKAEETDLSRLKTEAHCSSCNIRFDANFESAVELTFRPVAALRSIQIGYFCVGGPMRTPHVVAQKNLSSGEAWAPAPELITELNDPILRVASIDKTLKVDRAAQAQLGEDQLIWGNEVDHFEVVNQTDGRRKVCLEEGLADPSILTAARVLAMPTFRDLFSDQILAPDAVVSLRPMAFLFTDLKGSTAMYEAYGDAESFGRVKAHFDLLLAEIEEHRGSLVKTIGDAVMASFDDPADAMRCAIKMQQRVESESDLVLKLGLHYGRVMAVTLNDRLDYFGATVNRAARLEGQSRGGDIVCSRAVYEDPTVDQILKAAGFKLSYESLQVKGVEQAMNVLRVQVVGD